MAQESTADGVYLGLMSGTSMDGVDGIAVACENKEGISTALRKARQKGIKVLTYDSDSMPDARAWISGKGSHFTMYDDQRAYFTELLTFLKSA